MHPSVYVQSQFCIFTDRSTFSAAGPQAYIPVSKLPPRACRSLRGKVIADGANVQPTARSVMHRELVAVRIIPAAGRAADETGRN